MTSDPDPANLLQSGGVHIHPHTTHHQRVTPLLTVNYAWLDTGTHDSMIEASTFVRTLEKRQGQRIACPEGIAFMRGFITQSQLIGLGEAMGKSGYGRYLIRIAQERKHRSLGPAAGSIPR